MGVTVGGVEEHKTWCDTLRSESTEKRVRDALSWRVKEESSLRRTATKRHASEVAGLKSTVRVLRNRLRLLSCQRTTGRGYPDIADPEKKFLRAMEQVEERDALIKAHCTQVNELRSTLESSVEKLILAEVLCQAERDKVSSSKAEANQLRAEAFSWHRQVEANEMMKQKQLAAQQTVTYQLQAQVEQSRKSTQHLETWCFSLQQELRTARKQLSEKDRQLAQMSKNFEALRRDMKFDADLADKDPGRQVNASSCVREPMPPQRSSTHRKPASQVAVPRRSPASCRSFLPRTPSPQPSTRCTTPIEPYVLPLEPTYKTVNVLVY